MIKLHPQLEKDCIVLGEFSLCILLLLNDANYPWFILVPKREDIKELHQLSKTEQQLFLQWLFGGVYDSQQCNLEQQRS